MLLEKTQRLIELSKQKVELGKYAQNRQGFEAREKQLEEAISSLRLLVEAVKVFRDRGLGNVDVRDKADGLLKFIEGAESQFQNNREWIVDNKNFNGKTFQKSIKNLENSVSQELQQNWQQYLAQKMPSTNDELLNVLGNIDSFQAKVKLIRQLKSTINKDNFPKTEREFQHLEDCIKHLKNCWNDLSGDEVPESVLTFLKNAVSNEGAPLHLLTPEVKQWLDRHKISQAFRVCLI
jgi:flagellin-specific chaperone FliS